jgi:endonuclease-3
MPHQKAEAQRLREILSVLETRYPGVGSPLRHRSAWELLVATILSAQCTDQQVNRITPELFRRYPTPKALAGAEVGTLENVIRSIGLFRNKAQNLIAMAREIAEHYGGRVPRDRKSLEALPGVGRKTASVVLGQAFGEPAFAVDTHVGRVCHRLGFSTKPDPLEVERRVTALLAPGRWAAAHLVLIRHGRDTCTARSPKCPECPVRRLCPWPEKTSAARPAASARMLPSTR